MHTVVYSERMRTQKKHSTVNLWGFYNSSLVAIILCSIIGLSGRWILNLDNKLSLENSFKEGFSLGMQ